MYKVVISPRAQKELENAIDYYSLYSAEIPKHFIDALESTYDSLSNNPFFAIRYKNVRALKINRFPYTIYFEINNEKSVIRVLSCFHNKRNPKKRPKR